MVIKIDVRASIDFCVVCFDITALDLHMPRLTGCGNNHLIVVKYVPSRWAPFNGLARDPLVAYVDGNCVLRVAPIRPGSSADDQHQVSKPHVQTGTDRQHRRLQELDPIASIPVPTVRNPLPRDPSAVVKAF